MQRFAAAMGPILASTHTVLDLMLVPAYSLQDVVGIQSDRLRPIASHHFPIVASFSTHLDHCEKKQLRPKRDLSTLTASVFRDMITTAPETVDEEMQGSLDTQWDSMRKKLRGFVDANTQVVKRTRQRPWIRQNTLNQTELKKHTPPAEQRGRGETAQEKGAAVSTARPIGLATQPCSKWRLEVDITAT